MVILSNSHSAPDGSFWPFGKAAMTVAEIKFVPGCNKASNTIELGGMGSSGLGIGVALWATWLFTRTCIRKCRCCCSSGGIRAMSCSRL